MFLPCSSLNDQSAAEFDYVFLGAGAVGIYSAVKLARAGRRVLLLDAGPCSAEANYEDRNSGQNIGRQHRGLRTGRMRGIGGTTRLWGGQLSCFTRGDFARRDEDGKLLWPISYDDVREYYVNVLADFGLKTHIIDVPVIWERCAGVSRRISEYLDIFMNSWLRNPDFASHFEDELKNRQNLVVIAECEASYFRLAIESNKISSIVLKGRGQELKIPSSARVVMTCGTFDNSRVLLATSQRNPLSKIASNGCVGKYFFDHLHGVAGSLTLAKRKLVGRYFDNLYIDGIKHSIKVRLSDRVLMDGWRSNGAATLNSTMSVKDALSDGFSILRRITSAFNVLHLKKSFRTVWNAARILFPLAIRYLVSSRSLRFGSGDITVGIELEQMPVRSSQILLDPDSEQGISSILLDWRISGKECLTAKLVMHELTRSLAEKGIGSIDTDQRILAGDPSFLLDCHDSNHQMGGTRMGLSNEDAVVDTDLQSFDIGNLTVLGASTFPSGSFANPTFTALAFANRFILQQS